MTMRSIYYILLCFVLPGFIACQEEKADAHLQGRIRLSITDWVQTKAMPEALTPTLTDQFQVKMIRREDNRLVFRGTCADFNAQPLLFKSGEHIIQASYGENVVLGSDAPYYVSEEKSVMVEAGKEQEVVLACQVGNALASFEFVNVDKLEKVLKDYYIEVKVKGESIKWYPGSAENPYFKAGSEVEFYLKGIWIENNSPYSRKFASVLPVEAGKRYHYKLKFDTSNMTGAILNIEVEAEVENVTVNQTLPLYWLPKPKITADGFDEENQLIYTETADAKTAVIHFAGVRSVQEVELTFDFTDPHLSALNKTYLFSSLTEEEKEALQNAAVILSALDGATTGAINLTAMVPALLTLEGGREANNQIRVRVKANDRWSDEANYTIKTVKPVFSIGVYPGNIWTKEFTANPLVADSVKTGNFNRFSDITYEFSADGTNWTALATDLRKDGLTPGTTYYVRPKYRGQVPGESTTIRTEACVVLPNADMEQWNDYELGTGPHNIPFFEPWAPGETDKWWNTNNARSTVYRQAAFVYQSTTYPTVSKTKSANSGTYAAEIRTIGASNANTIWDKPQGFIPGKLFIGSYSYTGSNRLWDGTETIDKGHEFSVKPTKLTFMYQYASYKGAGEKFLCEIELRNQHTVLGRGSFSDSDRGNYTMGIIEIDYSSMDVTLPIDNIFIIFKSSESESPAGYDWIKKLTLEGYGSNWAAYLGSLLRIDDISLVYEK